MKSSRRRFIAVILITAAIVIGFTAGFEHQRLFNQPTAIVDDFGLLQESWGIINRKFNGSTDNKKMLYGAIKGSVESLDDPYSTFLDPSMVKRFSEDLQGTLEGIGAQLTKINNQIVIVAPLKDSPAEKAKLKPKDKIMAINGQSTENMTLEEATEKIRGQPGTEVTLTIIPAEDSAPARELKISRAKIAVPSVTVKDNQIIVSQFGDDTMRLFRTALQRMTREDKGEQEGIILDLRNNPGGYLDGAIEMISLLVDEDVAVWQQDVKGKKIAIKTTTEPIVSNRQLVVLINKGSASAAEIVAGALQDYGRAKIVGENSFGKGSVQDLEELSDGSALKLTIAQWLTPQERQIDKIGIKPDIEVKDDEKTEADEQLDRARAEL